MRTPRRSVIVGAAALGTVLLLGGASTYLVWRIEDQVEAVRSLEALRTGQERKVARIAALQRAVRAVAEDSLALERRFVAREEVVAVLEELESLARRAGVSLTITRVEERTGEAQARGAVVVGIKLVGAREDVEYLVALLETLPRAARLTALSLRRMAEGENRWRAETTLALGMVKENTPASEGQNR